MRPSNGTRCASAARCIAGALYTEGSVTHDERNGVPSRASRSGPPVLLVRDCAWVRFCAQAPRRSESMAPRCAPSLAAYQRLHVCVVMRSRRCATWRGWGPHRRTRRRCAIQPRQRNDARQKNHMGRTRKCQDGTLHGCTRWYHTQHRHTRVLSETQNRRKGTQSGARRMYEEATRHRRFNHQKPHYMERSNLTSNTGATYACHLRDTDEPNGANLPLPDGSLRP